MKIMAGLVAAAAIGLLPIAQAQVACGGFAQLVELAWDDFEEIIGDEVEDGIFEADHLFDGADHCTVTLDVFAEYACLFVYPTEAEGSSGYASARVAFDSCLAAWARENVEADGSDTTFTAIRSQVASGRDELADLEWYLTFERHNRPEGPDWHVVLALTYF